VTNLKRISQLLALGACLAAAGCGADDEGKPIPAETAVALQTQLDTVQRRLDDGSVGACQDILEGPREPNRDSVQQLIDGLPDDVDPDVRAALEESFENLWSLVESTCQEREPAEPAEPAPTPEPEETETETETETAPETTTPETTPPEEEILPPEGDGDNDGAVPGNGNGNGRGNGNGGGFGPGGANKGGGE
jgi:hypothetical protein